MTETCTAEGCHAPFYAKGLCKNHYYRLRRQGSLLTLGERGLLVGQQPCSVKGCGKPATARGKKGQPKLLCNTHYVKLWRSGTLKRTVFGKEWRERQSVSKRTPLSYLDPTPDLRKGHRGFLAVNVVADIRAKAQGRRKKWLLKPEEAYKLITGSCHYCGAASGWPETRNGIDRKDNVKHYTRENSVSCCMTCNAAKGRLTEQGFKDWAARLHNRFSQV